MCVTPPSKRPKAFAPLLSLNNQTWTPTTNTFEYYANPVLVRLDPVLGPLTGGTSVLLYGTGFFNTTRVSALFDRVEVVCKLAEVIPTMQPTPCQASLERSRTPKPNSVPDPIPTVVR